MAGLHCTARTTLQRQIGPLDTSRGLARVRTERLDLELVHGASELCDAFAGRACTVLDVEHAELVAIERDRFAVRCQMLAQRLEIAERRLGRREMQRHQPASCIVNEHQQRAGRRTFLEPADLEFCYVGQDRLSTRLSKFDVERYFALIDCDVAAALDLSSDLDGRRGTNRANERMQGAAHIDLDALRAWLARFADTKTTFDNYRKEAERLVLWSVLRMANRFPP